MYLLKKVKNYSKIHVEKLRVFKTRVIIERAEHLVLKLNSLLEELKDKGISVEEVEDLVEEFNNLIDEARDNYYKAMDLYEAAKEIRHDEYPI